MTSRTEGPSVITPLARTIRAVVGAVLAVLSTAAAAAEDEPSKLYAGVGLAATNFESDHEGIGYSAAPVGWQLYGGLQARERMAVELAIDRVTGMDSGDILGSGVERLRISAQNSSITMRGVFSLSLDGVLPKRQKITLVGSVGLARTSEERSVTELTTSRQTSVSEDENGLVLGAGALFNLSRLRLRAHYQTLDRSGPSLDSFGVAAEFRF
jgi:hypothetical protein